MQVQIHINCNVCSQFLLVPLIQLEHPKVMQICNVNKIYKNSFLSAYKETFISPPSLVDN